MQSACVAGHGLTRKDVSSYFCVYTSVELVQSARAVLNIAAMECGSTSIGIPTKVHEHSSSQPSGIPAVHISSISARGQFSSIREVPISSFIATATITNKTVSCSTAIRTGWCSTAGDIISHTVQSIRSLANDRWISPEDTVVREHCTLQSEARSCVQRLQLTDVLLQVV